MAHCDVVHGDTSGHGDTAHGNAPHEDVQHGDAHNDSTGGSSHSDVAHQDASHANTAHGDSHQDTAHSNTAHANSAHGNTSHQDTTVAHSNVHTNYAHTNNPHTNIHTNSVTGHSNISHSDVSHSDSHGNTAHTNNAHTNIHADSVTRHSNISHSDVSHSDSHGNTAHTNTNHTNVHVNHANTGFIPPHNDIHQNTGHGDTAHNNTTHSDTAHSNTAHGDHSDSVHNDTSLPGTHNDQHTNIGHGDTAHNNTTHSDTAHSNTAHGDHYDSVHNDTSLPGTHNDQHTNIGHGDSAHGNTHTNQQGSHNDTAHANASHSDVTHADVTAVVSHSDTAHADGSHANSAHQNAHTDTQVHTNVHSDHSDTASPPHLDFHGDQTAAHADVHTDTASLNDPHCDVAHADHADTNQQATRPDAPSAPTPTRGNGQVSVAWTAPNNNGAAITDYDLQYRVSPAGSPVGVQLLPSPGFTGTSKVVSPLTNGTAYQFRVSAANSVGRGQWSPWSIAVTPSTDAANVPATPSAPTATPGNAQATVSWTAPNNNGAAITDYDLQYRKGAGGPIGAYIGVFTGTSKTITGLVNGTSYQFRVRAQNSAGESAWSLWSTGVTPSVDPSPGNLIITGLPKNMYTGQDPVSLGATLSRTTVGATIYVWSVTGPGTLNKTSGPTVTLTANGTGTITVNCRGSGFYMPSRPSPSHPIPNPVAFTEAGSASTTVGNFRVAISTPDGASVAVKASLRLQAATQNAPGTVAYRWSVIGGQAGGWGTLDARYVSLVNFTGTRAGRVTVQCEATASGQSVYARTTITVTTPTTIPDPPSVPIATASNARAIVTWGAPANNGGQAITDYDLQYRESPSGTAVDVTGVGNVTTYTVTNLVNATAYQFRARAANATGESAWSAWSAAVTPTAGVGVPGAPSAPTGTAGNAQVVVTWTAPNNNGAAITDYDLQHRTFPAGSPQDVTVGNVTQATVTPLTNGTSYQFRVRAQNSAGESAWSPWSAAVTPQSGPAARLVITTGLAPGNYMSVGDIVPFAASFSRAIAAGSDQYFWSVPTGSPVTLLSTSGPTVRVRADTAGAFTVNCAGVAAVLPPNPTPGTIPTPVAVTENGSVTGTVQTFSVSVTGPTSGVEGATVSLTAVLSNPPPGAVSYLWRYIGGQGASGTLSNVTSNPALLKLDSGPGTVSVRVTATVGGVSAFDIYTITVTERDEPVTPGTLTISGLPAHIEVGQPATVVASLSRTDTVQSTERYSWRVKSGPGVLSSGTGQSVRLTATGVGTITIEADGSAALHPTTPGGNEPPAPGYIFERGTATTEAISAECNVVVTNLDGSPNAGSVDHGGSVRLTAESTGFPSAGGTVRHEWQIVGTYDKGPRHDRRQVVRRERDRGELGRVRRHGGSG